jgi:predicted transcriptional regulator
VSKKDILNLIRRMPNDASASQILDEIYFRVQVEKGLRDVEAGRVLTEGRLKARVARWRRSAGR